MPEMYSDRDTLAKRIANLEETFNKSLHMINKANKLESVKKYDQTLEQENLALREQLKNNSGLRNDSSHRHDEGSYTPPRMKNRSDWKN